MSWPTVEIAEVAEIISGGTPKSGVAEYWDGGIPWATPRDLSKLTACYIDATPRTLSQTGLVNSSANLLPAHSVLFSSRAPIGHVAINSVPMATNQGFKNFVPDVNRLDPKYLFHWLKSNRTFLESLGNGATFKEVSKAVVAKIRIPLPPLPEQRRIAAILDQADALRVKRRITVDLLNQLTQSVFNRNLEAGMSGSTVKFGDLCNRDLRNGISPSLDGDVDFDVLTLSAVTGLEFNAASAKAGKFKKVPPVSQTVSKESFLICRGNGNKKLVGRAFFADIDMPKTAFPDTIIAARPDLSRVVGSYLQFVWNTDLVRSQIERAARTTNGTFKINQKSLEGIEIPLLNLAEQRVFEDFDQAVGMIRRRMRSEGGVLDDLFLSLQSRAFRGEL